MSSYNPALLRLELLAQGMKVDANFNKQLGGALKEPLWTQDRSYQYRNGSSTGAGHVR